MELTRDKVMDKIRKLLALSTSSNVNEAAVAAAAAQRLMFQYKVEMTEVEIATEEAEPIVDLDILADSGQKCAMRWQVVLLNSIARANFCRLVITPWSAYSKSKLRVFGKKADIQTTNYLYLAVTSHIHESCDRWAKEEMGSPSRTQRGSFRYGAAITVGQRMMDARRSEEAKLRIPEASTRNTTAIVHVETAERQVDEHLRKLFPKTKAHRTSRSADYSSYQAGRQAGHSIPLSGGRNALTGMAPRLNGR